MSVGSPADRRDKTLLFRVHFSAVVEQQRARA
jgi:hypothetical protein